MFEFGNADTPDLCRRDFCFHKKCPYAQHRSFDFAPDFRDCDHSVVPLSARQYWRGTEGKQDDEQGRKTKKAPRRKTKLSSFNCDRVASDCCKLVDVQFVQTVDDPVGGGETFGLRVENETDAIKPPCLCSINSRRRVLNDNTLFDV